MDENKDNVATNPSHKDAEFAVKERQQSVFDKVLNLFESEESKRLKENKK